MKQYYSTENIAKRFDLSPKWFVQRKNDNTFKRGVHYLQRSANATVRWDYEALVGWFNGDDLDDETNDEYAALAADMVKC
jgi:TPP-dependent 2-oxoacid decarboxylase